MSIFSKLFGSSSAASEEDNDKENKGSLPEKNMLLDEQFIYNFKKNGGKFLYCENLEEVKEQFENILQENDWYESEVLCYEPTLFELLEENKLVHTKVTKPVFLFAGCENLIAEEGSVMFTSLQIKQLKPYELPTNIIVLAKTSQILAFKTDGLSAIKKKYEGNYPTNITAIKYFEKAKEEDFTQYGSSAKNLYLLLLEDL